MLVQVRVMQLEEAEEHLRSALDALLSKRRTGRKGLDEGKAQGGASKFARSKAFTVEAAVDRRSESGADRARVMHFLGCVVLPSPATHAIFIQLKAGETADLISRV